MFTSSNGTTPTHESQGKKKQETYDHETIGNGKEQTQQTYDHETIGKKKMRTYNHLSDRQGTKTILSRIQEALSIRVLLVICSADTPSKSLVFIPGHPLGEMGSGHGAPTEWKSAGGSHTTHGSTTLHKTAEMLEPEVLGQNGFKHFHVTLFPLSPI